MSRSIEVKEGVVGQTFDTTTPAGLYVAQGGVWLAPGGGAYPVFITTSYEFNNLIHESAVLDAVSVGGVSESTLLKALAIAQDPTLAKELI